MRATIPTLLLLLVLSTSIPLSAELLSRSYEFRDGVTLEIGAEVPGGLRLDGVRFRFPDESAGALMRLRGVAKADVAVSNVGDVARRVGVAIALYDGAGNLVGVASGGSKMLALRPDRQATYSLAFEDVKLHSRHATSFRITVESK